MLLEHVMGWPAPGALQLPLSSHPGETAQLLLQSAAQLVATPYFPSLHESQTPVAWTQVDLHIAGLHVLEQSVAHLPSSQPAEQEIVVVGPDPTFVQAPLQKVVVPSLHFLSHFIPQLLFRHSTTQQVD